VGSKITITDLVTAKSENRKFVTVSCYDHTTAKLTSQTDTEMVLAGDSAAQVMLGFGPTLSATMDFMVTITTAVHRGAPNLCLAADMPFLSYQVGITEAVKNASRFPDDKHSCHMKSGEFQRLQELLKGES
jgi:3-methyl-2-oxobutanoate hydroxymethyltransferase